MVDPRVVHSITIEICTGFLLLGATAVIVKIVADYWLRHFRGRSHRLDHWALSASRYAEPSSYFGLTAGVLATFISIVTGTLAWPIDQLWASSVAHNKILLTATTQVVFIGAVIVRTRYGFEIWMTRATGGLYALLVATGLGLLVLQNSVAGHLAGKGSLLDEFLHAIGIDTHPIWLFPSWAAVLLAVAFPVAAALVGLGLRVQSRRLKSASAAG